MTAVHTQTPAPWEGPDPLDSGPGSGGQAGGGVTGVDAAAGTPAAHLRQRDADAVAHNGISAVLRARFGFVPLSVRVAAANAALTAAADWCRAYRRRLEQERAEGPTPGGLQLADRGWIDAELDRLALVLPEDPNPIYAELTRAPGSSDPHREQVIDNVQALLNSEALGLGEERARQIAAAIVDRLGVA